MGILVLKYADWEIPLLSRRDDLLTCNFQDFNATHALQQRLPVWMPVYQSIRIAESLREVPQVKFTRNVATNDE
mgnify:CR=1 FL=1